MPDFWFGSIFLFQHKDIPAGNAQDFFLLHGTDCNHIKTFRRQWRLDDMGQLPAGICQWGCRFHRMFFSPTAKKFSRKLYLIIIAFSSYQIKNNRQAFYSGYHQNSISRKARIVTLQPNHWKIIKINQLLRNSIIQ